MAFNKSTSQSSTMMGVHYAYLYNSHLAVDGNKDNRADYAITMKPLCSTTGITPAPVWWQVDLDSTYEVQQVVIYGHMPDPPGRHSISTT